MGTRLRTSRRIVPAAILIALGLSLLAGNVFSFDVVDNLWPVVLIALGLLWILRGPLWLGMVSIVAGAIFLAEEFGAPVRMETAWPLLIVALGVAILFSRDSRFRKRASATINDSNGAAYGSDSIESSVSFSSRSMAVTSTNFRGGTVSATFGSLELDLRQAQLHENGADLDLSSTFRQHHASRSDNVVASAEWLGNAGRGRRCSFLATHGRACAAPADISRPGQHHHSELTRRVSWAADSRPEAGFSNLSCQSN